jgi:TRAP-type C4-dicarboxylate transport system permease small subunit
MKELLEKADAFSTGLNRWVARFTAVLIIVQFAMVLYGVFFRYVLDNPLPWVLPITKILLIWIGLLGISIAFKSMEHVAVKGLVYVLPENLQKVTFTINYALIIMFLLTLIIKGFPIAFNATELIMVSATIHIPKIWTMMAVPVSAVINLVHLIPIPSLISLELEERDRMLEMKS